MCAVVLAPRCNRAPLTEDFGDVIELDTRVGLPNASPMSRRRVLLAPWLLAALLRAGIAGYYHSTVLSFFLHYLWRAASLSVGTLGTSWGGIGVVATSGFLL